MIAARLARAQQYLEDAQDLLRTGRLASAVSRAYYAAYQGMWAALEDPPDGGRWRHVGIISHFVRGYWFTPTHPPTGPGLLEPLRFPLHRLYRFRLYADYDLVSLPHTDAEEGVQTVQRVITEVAQHTQGAQP